MAADVVCVASWNVDLVARVPRPLTRGETLSASHFETSAGGKGSNAAIAAARQGARTALVARIGADDFGRMALDLWRAEGIDAQHVEQAAGERSGVAQILVYDDGDNSIAVFHGANAGLAAAHVERARAALLDCKVVLASCEVPLEATEAAFRLARAHGIATVLNPAPVRPLPRSLLELVDVLTPNENELLALVDDVTGASTDAAARLLLARGVHAVVVTLGRAGCALYRPGAPPHAIAGHRVRVVDTIGAGDTFNGALSAGLARGEPLERAMASANAAAALSVTGRGAIAAMPTREQVERLLAGAEGR